MARVTRQSSTVATTIGNETPSAGNLEPSSTLPSKRPLPRVAEDKENDGSPLTPKLKRVALVDKTNTKPPRLSSKSKFTAKPPKISTQSSSLPKSSSEWDVTGKYRLECITSDGHVDTSSLVEVHYEAGPPGQLYATFSFVKLRGIMRMCHSSLLKRDSGTGFVLKDFEAACDLPEGFKPNPASATFLMRWRGHDGDSLVGGETRAHGQFHFLKETANSSADFQDFKIQFDMIHKGEYVAFKGTKIKTSGLQSLEGWSLEKEWHAHYDKKWDEDTEDNSDSHSSSLRTISPSMGSYFQEIDKRTYYQPTCPFLETSPDWAWDVTGVWDITAPMISRSLKTS